MATPKELYYEKRGQALVKNLQSRHFDACYCTTKEQALEKALEWIPEGVTVGWGGAQSCHEIGLIRALNSGNYRALAGQFRLSERQIRKIINGTRS